MTDPQLEHLIAQIRADRARGKHAALEDYCAGVPELLGQLRQALGDREPLEEEAPTQMSLSPPRGFSEALPKRAEDDPHTLLSMALESPARREHAAPPSTDSDMESAPTIPPRVSWQDAVTMAGKKQDDTAKPGEKPAPPRKPAFPELPGYEIQAELGRGGMGVVYKARQTALKRVVALKMIRSGIFAGDAEVARFRAEAEAAARLQHPNIVQVYEIGTHEERPFFALEYVEGGTLSGFLEGKPQPERDAARLLETIARAIHFAHERGVLHRDLKPANILLGASRAKGKAESRRSVAPPSPSEIANLQTSVGVSGSVAAPAKDSDTPSLSLSASALDLRMVPKVTDFGLAKFIETGDAELPSGSQEMTPSGAVLGTPSYMAPEQAQASKTPLGPAADVYGLGAILYTMLTGRPPFAAASPMETILQVLDQEPAPPRLLRPALSRDIETICVRCLEKDPGRRYASAEALADDLRRYLNHEPIQARPAGLIERTAKWARRKPALAALCAFIFVGVVVLAFMNYWLVLARGEEKAARERAQREEARARLEEGKAKRNFELASQAVEEFLTKVSENPHLKDFDLEELRTDLLQTAVAFHRKFVEQKSDDPDVRAEQGRAFLRLALILKDVGQKQQALEHDGQAERIFATLVGEHPDASLYLRDWGLTWNRLAGVHSELGELDKARQAIDKAIALREQLVARPDALAKDTNDLAISFNNKAAFLTKTGDKTGAEPLYLQAIKLQQALAEVHPKEASFHNDLARTHYNLGTLLAGAERDRAVRELSEAARLWKRLVDDTPRPTTFLTSLATCYGNMAALAFKDSPREAAKLYLQAEAILKQATEKHPSITFYRGQLARTYSNLALCSISRDEKRDYGLKALKLQEQLVEQHPRATEFRYDCARTYLDLGYLARLNKKADDALVWFGKAASAARQLLDVAPDHAAGRTLLFSCLAARAEGRLAGKDYKLALLDYDAIIRLAPPAPAAVQRHARCLALLGLHGQAAAEAEDVMKSLPQPEAQYEFARLYGLCLAGVVADHRLAEEERGPLLRVYAGRAVASLEAARKAGFFDDAVRRERLVADPDLAAVRARDEGAAWLSALSKN